MADTRDHLDCCDAPATKAVRTYYEGRHDIEALHRCASCGRYWFYRYSEYLAGDYEDWTVWWTEVPDELAASLLANSDPPRDFLKGARTITCDASGATEATGQPDAPFS